MTLLAQAFTAYLGPLLKKHEAGKYVFYEDLAASYAATKQVLKEGGDNFFVSKRIDDMHKTQVQAYREAGTKALRAWAQSNAVPLAAMEENDTEQKFVERCVAAMLKLKTRPNWKIDNAKVIVTVEIRKRAKAIYAKYHPADEEDAEDGEEEEGEEGEEGEEETEEEEEDGEMEEDGEVETAKPKAKNNAGAKKNNGNNNKGKGKNAPKKKGNAAKAGTPAARAQGRKPANRGRRTARGGKSNNNS